MSNTNLPAVGSKIHLKVGDDMPCPFAERMTEAFLRGWAAFFAGESDPGTEGISACLSPRDTAEDLFKKGYSSARSHKSLRECHVWTFQGVEEEGGKRMAVITREEPRCYDDVMNGSGTGLGTNIITERIPLDD